MLPLSFPFSLFPPLSPGFRAGAWWCRIGLPCSSASFSDGRAGDRRVACRGGSRADPVCVRGTGGGSGWDGRGGYRPPSWRCE